METDKIEKTSKEKLVEFVKENIGKIDGDTVRASAKDVADALGKTGELMDLYYELRESLFDDGLIVGRGETKGGDMVFEFRLKGEYDEKPDNMEEFRKNEELYKELEADIAGLSSIAKMELFNEFDPEKVVRILRDHKDVIDSVRSIDNDTIGVRFKKGIDSEKAVEAMVDMVSGSDGFEADDISYDNGEVEFWWD